LNLESQPVEGWDLFSFTANTPSDFWFPIVYNSSSYISMEALQLLDGRVDIYMPDFKIWDPGLALKYLAAKDYLQAARRATGEMYGQVWKLRVAGISLYRQDFFVRHLLMPRNEAGTRKLMRFLACEIFPIPI
jgi:putative pyruvate formate lyase activating enzyme